MSDAPPPSDDPQDEEVAHDALPYRPAYCLGCNERLSLLAKACARCGRAFDARRPETFSSVRLFLPWQFWFPGFCLSVVSGVISYAFVMRTGSMGYALFVAVPVSFGAILGYAGRTALWWKLVLLGLVIPSMVIAVVSLNFAGFFCGFTLGAIFFLPGIAGVLLGIGLRWLLRKSRWNQRMFLPLALLCLLPYLAEAIEESIPRERVVAVVQTSLTIDATPAEAWRAVMTYEDVEHEPPLLLRLALPKPIRSEGRKSTPGDVVNCIYDRGRLCKRITEVVPERRLAFEVTEQHLHFEHDVKLLGGSFEFAAAGDHQTTITLTTRYEKRLRPEAIWGPIERRVIHTLHEHVLEGMRRKARQSDDLQRYSQPPPKTLAANSRR